MQHTISINDNGIHRQCLKILFLKDGGFSVLPASKGVQGYLITKLNFKQKFGISKIPWDDKNIWQTYHTPKLTHHIDGNVQVSGSPKIRSGFYKTSGKPKGIYSRSMDLFLNNNDGGPIFTFTIWGIDHFKAGKESDITVDELNLFNNPHLPPKNKLAYSIHGYYFDLKAINYLNYSTGNITYRHPTFGIIPTKLVPGRKESPGLLSLLCYRTNVEFASKFGCSIGGGASRKDANGNSQHIFIQYPLSEFARGKRYKNIEYRGIYKIYSFLDNLLSNIKQSHYFF